METRVKKIGGKWTPQFKIGNQTFSLQSCELKADADFFALMLDKAFLKLNKFDVIKSVCDGCKQPLKSVTVEYKCECGLTVISEQTVL